MSCAMSLPKVSTPWIPARSRDGECMREGRVGGWHDKLVPERRRKTLRESLQRSVTWPLMPKLKAHPSTQQPDPTTQKGDSDKVQSPISATLPNQTGAPVSAEPA